MAELCDMQEKEVLSSMMEFLDRLNVNVKQKDHTTSRSDVTGWLNGASNSAIAKKDAKQLLDKATKGEDDQVLHEAHEMIKLREALEADHEAINALNFELEEERKAAAIAASETMAMISRLQKEKAALQMEARQYQRMVEEKVYYDEEAIVVMKDIISKKEEEKLALEKELGMYKRRSWSREGSSSSLPGHDGGKGVEMILVKESKADSSSQNDAFVDQLGYSMINQNGSIVSTETNSSGDQAQTKEGYAWIDLEILTHENLGNNEKPQERNVDYCPRSGGKKPSNYFGSASSATRVTREDGMHEEKKSDEGGDGTQHSVEIGWIYCASGSIDVDGLSDLDKDSHANEQFCHGGQNETLDLQRPLDIVELRKIEQKQFSEEECRDGDQERVTISQKSPTMLIQKVEAKFEGINSSFTSPCKIGQVASNIFPKRVRQDDVSIIGDDEILNSGQPLSRATDDKVWGAKDPTFKIRRVDRKLSASWDMEDLYSPSVHDVYEVKDDSFQNSLVDHTKLFESISEPNDWEFLKKYGKAWESNTLILNSALRTGNGAAGTSEPSSQELLSGIRRWNGSSSEKNLTENDTQRYVVGDRLGKPDSSSPRSNFLNKTGGSNREFHRTQKLLCQRREAAPVSVSEKAWLPTDNPVQNNSNHAFLHPFHFSLLEDSADEEGYSSMALEENSKGAVQDQIKQLTLRLHSLEAERESLKQAIVSLKKGIGEMQMLQEISHLGKLACWFLRAANVGEGLADPVGLTYILANKSKLQATYCVTRALKVEIVQHDHDSDTVLMAQNELGWPTDAHGFSETAFNGWNF